MKSKTGKISLNNQSHCIYQCQVGNKSNLWGNKGRDAFGGSVPAKPINGEKYEESRPYSFYNPFANNYSGSVRK